MSTLIDERNLAESHRLVVVALPNVEREPFADDDQFGRIAY